MINNGLVSEDTKNLVDFIHSLPSAKNIRVYTQLEQDDLDLSSESASVRRSAIREKNRSFNHE